MAITAHLVNVFACADGSGGNPLGFVRDAGGLSAAERQEIAFELGYSETVFVLDGRRIAIHTPTVELPFAGHPMVGAAWMMDIAVIEPPSGPVRTRKDGDSAFVVARAEVAPAWDAVRYFTTDEVDGLPVPATGHLQCWAWQDEAEGRIRARVFAPDYGVPEDPATGSAALRLCALLGRPIVIEQGAGSEIRARPLETGEIELGGRVVRRPDRTI
jgi:predicted PhzF superfamily epimerase YddE/YHI9